MTSSNQPLPHEPSNQLIDLNAPEQAYRLMPPKNLERGPLYHANQIMQQQVITVSTDDDVAQAWRILRDHGIHLAPVLDSGMRLVGVSASATY